MKLNNLQILRGISALLVCCFHFRDYINFQDFKLGDILFRKGSIGVPIFFVISGFIMAFTTRKIDFTQNTFEQVSSFYKKRIIRIVPLYYLLTIAWIVLGGSIFFYLQDKNTFRLIYSILFLPQKNVMPVLYLGWSLNYEMFFYLIFGISLLFRQKRYEFIVIFFILTYILGLTFNFENPYLQMVTSFTNLYFVVGILFSLLLSKTSIPKNLALFLSTLGIISFACLFFNIYPVNNELLILIIVALFVFAFLLSDFKFHLKSNKFLVFMGDISYSLYLSHPFVEIFFRRFKVEGYYNIPYFLLKIAVVIAVAAFLYYFVEKKVTQYLKIKMKA